MLGGGKVGQECATRVYVLSSLICSIFLRRIQSFFILVEVSNEGLRREVNRGCLCLLQFLIFGQWFCGVKKFIGYIYKLVCVLYPSDQDAYCKGVKVQFPD